jgi:hypothetical protein
MPKVATNELTFTEELRRVLMFDSAIEGNTQEAGDAGGDGCIAKPTNTRTFHGLVAGVLPASQPEP